jgi:hypothetical protein
MVMAIAVIAGLRVLRRAVGGFGHQFWRGLQIPVGVGRFDVAEVGRQQWHSGRDITTVAAPIQQRADREGVSEIMGARPA